MSKIALEGNASGTGTLTIASQNTNSNFTLTLPNSSGTVVVTGGAQTIEFAAGTVSAPSITTTGDTNTGIFFPAADTIAFTEGGAEAMRIDSSGRLLVGLQTAIGSWGSAKNQELQIASGGVLYPGLSAYAFSDTVSAGGMINLGHSRSGTVGTITATQSGDILGYLIFEGANSSNALTGGGYISVVQNGAAGAAYIPADMTFFTSNTTNGPQERMRIDSSGNVGIGTSDSLKFNTTGSANTKRLTLFSTGTGASTRAEFQIGSAATADTEITGLLNFGCGASSTTQNSVASIYSVLTASSTTTATGALVFNTTSAGTSAERARITSGGQFLVGGTSSATPAGSTSRIVSEGDFSSVGGIGFGMSVASTTGTGEDHYYISFQTATTTQRGYIYYNNGAGQVQLSATSDARLKENIVDAPNALPVLAQVKVRQYDWKDTRNTNIGFVAQELYEVIPRAVAVGKDTEDGEIQMAWGVDNSTLVPYLVKAIQELNAKVETLEAQNAAFEARLAALENK